MCTVHESKKIFYFILPHPLKNYLIFSHTPCLSLSLSLSLSHNSHPLPKLSQSLKLSSSLSHSPLTTDCLTIPSCRPIATPSQAADRLTVPCHRSPHRHSPLYRPSSPTHPFCRPSSPTLCLFVIGDC